MTRRSRLSPEERAAILERQGDLCPKCFKKLDGSQRIELDHRRGDLPRWFYINNPLIDPDDPEFIFALHERCHKKLFKGDIERIAKTKRVMGLTGQRARRRSGSTRKIPARANPWR